MLVVAWWLVLQCFGLAALPWAFRYFGRLPDRGYAFARPVGLLLVGYVLWIANVLGILANTTATVVVLLLAMGLVGWVGHRETWSVVRDLVTRQRRLVVVYELLFGGAFVLWSFVRSFMPEISATEKPMEFAFLNSALRSPTLPPADPWLAGYPISYYYLGYVLVAIIARVATVPSEVAFNLAIAMLFALAATGAFSLGYNLMVGARKARDRWPWATGSLSAVFVLLLANWEGLLELLRWHRLLPPALLEWIGIDGLVPLSANQPSAFPVDSLENWWWWRASRVIGTYVGDQAVDYTINEFPFFSFLLGDLHPHVIALPFAFVVLGYALNLLRSEDTPSVVERPTELLFVGILFGSLFVINAWDLLTYLFVLTAAFALRRLIARPRIDLALVRDTVAFGLTTFAVSVLVYLPFYLVFRSQASGLGVVIIRTQLQHFAIFWGPLLFLVGSFVVLLLWRGIVVNGQPVAVPAADWTRSTATFAITGGTVAALAFVGAPTLAVIVAGIVAGSALLWRYLIAESARPDAAPAERAGVSRRSRPSRSSREPAEIRGGASIAGEASDPVFVVLLVVTACLLLAVTELAFVRDAFGNRMNTVFKLYYQVWVMLAIAAAFGGSIVAQRALAATGPVRIGGRVWIAFAALSLAAGMVYAPMAVLSRSNGFSRSPTLDGLAYLASFQAEDARAIAWLRDHVAAATDGMSNERSLPVVVEATGGSYSQFGRVSMATGLPTLLGWDFHEMQWRGSSIVDEVNRRRADVETIYRSPDPSQVQQLLAEYGVSYVYVGPLERSAYGVDAGTAERFRSFMDVVYDRDGVTIYEVRK